MSLVALAAAATPAPAQVTAPGGTAAPSDPGDYAYVPFGSRDLRMGMRGDDVLTLNWILRSQAGLVPLAGEFQQPTDATVKGFQRAVGLPRSGVVNRTTRRALLGRMSARRATWYGPGFWGRKTACGVVLRARTIGVAHKTLPCGTRVTLAYRGRFVRTRVIDRGPYRRGFAWDLTKRAAQRIGFLRVGSGKVRSAIIKY